MGETLQTTKEPEKEKEKTLYQLAMHDNLTKLPNKEMFYEHVELTIKEAKEKRQTFALLFLDLDNFKEINDQYGHLAGDKFLRALSQRLRNTTRENDVIARFGGDEFVALLRDIKTPENAKKIAKNIASSVSTPFNIEGKPAHASASIGISLYPHNGSINSLLKAADEAMYNAKEAGKNRIRISLRTETQPIPADELPQSLRHP
jgi:diguanylate cyclase (GGDEF)-like protein